MGTHAQVTFVNNAAITPVVVEALGAGIGGALFVEAAIDVFNVSSCQFRHNSAQNGGGAVMLTEFAANATTNVDDSVFAVRFRQSGSMLESYLCYQPSISHICLRQLFLRDRPALPDSTRCTASSDTDGVWM